MVACWGANEKWFHLRVVRSFVIIFHARMRAVIARSGDTPSHAPAFARARMFSGRAVYRGKSALSQKFRMRGNSGIQESGLARPERDRAAGPWESGGAGRAEEDEFVDAGGGRASGARPRDRRARRAIGRGRASLSLLTRCLSLACFRHRHPTVSVTGVWLRGSE